MTDREKWVMFESYLLLIKFMYKFNVPFKDRMSYQEFTVYAEKIRNKKVS